MTTLLKNLLPESARIIDERHLRIQRLHSLLDSHPSASGPFLAQMNDPVDQHLVNSHFSLTALRRIHLDMVLKIDAAIHDNLELLVDRNVDIPLDKTPPPPVQETPSPPRFFSPTSEYIPEAKPIPLPKRSARKRNPYPKTSPKKVVIDLCTESDQPIERTASPIPRPSAPSPLTSSNHSPKIDEMNCINLKTGQFEDSGPAPPWRKLSKTKARKHRCLACNKIGHDEFDCLTVTCNFCKIKKPGHDTFHCPMNSLRYPSTSQPRPYRARNPRFLHDNTPVGEYSCNWPMGRPESPDDDEGDHYYDPWEDNNPEA